MTRATVSNDQVNNDPEQLGIAVVGHEGREIAVTLRGLPSVVIDVLANGLEPEALIQMGDAIQAELSRRKSE